MAAEKGRSHEKVSKPFPSVCFFCSSGLTLTRWWDLRGAARGHLSRPLYKSRIRRERKHASRQQPETKREEREREKPDERAAVWAHRATTAPGSEPATYHHCGEGEHLCDPEFTTRESLTNMQRLEPRPQAGAVVVLVLAMITALADCQGLFSRTPRDGDSCTTFMFTSTIPAVARILQIRVSPIPCGPGKVVNSAGDCVVPEDSDRCQPTGR